MGIADKLKKTVSSLFYGTKQKSSKKRINERTFVLEKHECPICHYAIAEGELQETQLVCPSCEHHFRMTPSERILSIADNGDFFEFSKGISSVNPLDFPGYEDSIERGKKSSNLNEAIITGTCSIFGRSAVLGIMTFQFMGGSMGSVVGEKVTRAILLGLKLKQPVVLFICSGGARMHEGILSLMQMAKTSAAAAKLEAAGIPLFVVLTDPTTGGVTASYAMLGNVILAEPEALIGFAGPRVIEGTIKHKLPPGFQRSEFQQEKGFVDIIVRRKEIKRTLAFLIDVHMSGRKRK
ncbi:MAG: acetyl-CoA carboxylase, carboxyltransferase subunit beta [Spirochaetales bacterium]|nr:acetyl-CoA carboxylase, carboxyltransferase subunit beta [Spirochaetales bacterium]